MVHFEQVGRRVLERCPTALSRSQFCCGCRIWLVQKTARLGVEGGEKTVTWGGGNRPRGALKAKHGVRVHPLHSLPY